LESCVVLQVYKTAQLSNFKPPLNYDFFVFLDKHLIQNTL
jgi:hypothetical protein